MLKKKAIRIDDIGASSKEFEIYGKTRISIKGKKLPVPIPGFITNFLFFKKFPLWKGWGPYNEFTPLELENLIMTSHNLKIKLSIAITAGWVDKNSKITEYGKKFPDHVKLLIEGIKYGVVEILSHGYTHCIVGSHLPKNFRSNRKEHREFYDFLGYRLLNEHVKNSKNILENLFQKKIEILVPPGNVFGNKTIDACLNNDIKVINCNTETKVKNGILLLGNENISALHDRDFKFKKNLINDFKNLETVFVSELAKNLIHE